MKKHMALSFCILGLKTYSVFQEKQFEKFMNFSNNIIYDKNVQLLSEKNAP